MIWLVIYADAAMNVTTAGPLRPHPIAVQDLLETQESCLLSQAPMTEIMRTIRLTVMAVLDRVGLSGTAAMICLRLMAGLILLIEADHLIRTCLSNAMHHVATCLHRHAMACIRHDQEHIRLSIRFIQLLMHVVMMCQ